MSPEQLEQILTPAETDSDHQYFNIGFVICSISSAQYVLQTPFSSVNVPDDLWRIGSEELASSTWEVLSMPRHH